MAALQPGESAEQPPAGIVTETPELPGVNPTVVSPAASATVEMQPSPEATVVSPTGVPTEAATAEAPPAPTLAATATIATLPTLVLPTTPALSNEDRWRAQQIDRLVLDPVQMYRTTSSDLWWYDPVNQQSIILGTIAGDFTVQAEFVLRSQGRDALEVPYQVNRSYGLTALSPAILDRIAAAGYTEWIETYVFRAPNVVRR